MKPVTVRVAVPNRRDQVYRLNVPDFQYVRVATAGAGSFARMGRALFSQSRTVHTKAAPRAL